MESHVEENDQSRAFEPAVMHFSNSGLTTRRVAKIFAAENSALSTGAPQSAGAVSTPSDGFTDLNEAGHQAVNRHRNALFGEDYFGC